MLRVLTGKEILEKGIVKEGYPQPVSVELPIKKLYKVTFSEVPLITNEKTFLPLYEKVKKVDGVRYLLEDWFVYVAELVECEMPSNCFGVLLPRSSLLRCGIIAQGTLIDPSFKGVLRVLIKPCIAVHIYENVRAFHLIVFCDDREFEPYRGQWQEK